MPARQQDCVAAARRPWRLTIMLTVAEDLDGVECWPGAGARSYSLRTPCAGAVRYRTRASPTAPALTPAALRAEMECLAPTLTAREIQSARGQGAPR